MNLTLCLLVVSSTVNYSGSFREGDWVSYTNFRYVTSVAMDQTVVYFGTTGGVIRYDRFAGQWLTPLTVTDGIPSSRIDNIAFDPSNGRIWVATAGGNAYYQPTFQQWYFGGEFPADLVRNEFDPGRFPVLTTPFGLSYQEGVITDQNFQQFQLTRGVGDGYDTMYVGTWGMGPLVINSRYGDLSTFSFGPYDSDVSTVVLIGDRLWIGDNSSSDPALTVFDRSSGEWSWHQVRYTDGLASAVLTSGALMRGSPDLTWLGTDYGLLRYRGNEDDFSSLADFSNLPSNLVLCVASDNLGVFAGTDNGLGYVGRSTKKEKHKPDSAAVIDTTEASGRYNFPVRSLTGFIINDDDIIGNYLYLATDRGVLRRELKKGSRYEYVNTPDRMLSTDIYDIAGTGDSLLFLTYRDIVIIDTSTGRSSTLTDSRYFDQWRMRKMAVDGLDIWVATDIGLWKYRLNDGYSRLFTAADGMISDDVRGLILDGDYLWLATPDGLIRFYWNNPDRID